MPLLHVPPDAALLSVAVVPPHIASVPVMPAGLAFTVTDFVAETAPQLFVTA